MKEENSLRVRWLFIAFDFCLGNLLWFVLLWWFFIELDLTLWVCYDEDD